MKQLKKWALRMLAALLLCGAVLSMSGAADGFVAQAGSAKERYEELENQLEELDSTIEQLGDKVASTKEQRAALQKQVDLLKEQITLLIGRIEAQAAEIVLKQQEIDAKRQEIADTDALFRQRIRTLYMVRNDGVLTTVLGANTYAEALTAADTLQRITNADTQLLDTLQQQKRELEEQEAQQQAMLAELEANHTELDAKQAALAASLQQVDRTLSSLDAQQAAAEAEYERLYEQYQEAKKQAEKEFLENAGNMTEYVGGEFAWPTPGYSYISSYFGWRKLYGRDDYHLGIDITGGTPGVIAGAEIVAVNDGYVTVARYGDTGYGIVAYIDHGGGVMTRYGHCSGLAVSAGQYVTKGQVIGYVGSTGNSTGYHLHFEIRVNGVAQDPMNYYKAT